MPGGRRAMKNIFSGLLGIKATESRRIQPPSRPPRSASARRKWEFILRRAESVGLERAHQEWKLRPTKRSTLGMTANSFSSFLKDMFKTPSSVGRILLTKADAERLELELEVDVPVPLTHVSGTVTLSEEKETT